MPLSLLFSPFTPGRCGVLLRVPQRSIRLRSSPKSRYLQVSLTYLLHAIFHLTVLSIGVIQSYGLAKRPEAVINCRNVKKKDMKWNSATPKMKVDAEGYHVTADGVHATVEPAERLPLTRAYNVF